MSEQGKNFQKIYGKYWKLISLILLMSIDQLKKIKSIKLGDDIKTGWYWYSWTNILI